MNKEIVCFADDVTGALDVAGSFYSRGYETAVQIEQDINNIPKTPCLVVNLNSRYDNLKKSAQKISEVVGDITLKAKLPIFLKVDSTLRGNILSDSKVLEQLDEDKPVFIAPAFPFYGRICVNGIYLVKGQPIGETEFAEDKAFNYKSSFLKNNVQDIEHIDWRVLDRGVNAIIEKVTTSKRGRFTFDTRDQTDLELIADAGLSIGASMIGSSGLARAFPKLSISQPLFNVDNSMPTLFVVGSIHQVSLRQKEELAKSGITGIELSHQDVGNTHVLEDLRDVTREHLEKDGTVFIASPNEITNDEILWKEIEDSVAQVSNIQDIKHNLVVVGGETAKATLRGRNIKTLLIRSEYESGVPMSTEPKKTKAILTKAGGFGHPNTLVDISHFMRR